MRTMVGGSIVVAASMLSSCSAFVDLSDLTSGDGDGSSNGVDSGLAADAPTGSDATSDGSPQTDGASTTTCDPLEAFGAPVLVATINTVSSNDGTLRLTADALIGVFWSDRPSGFGAVDLYVTNRPDPTSNFGAPTLLANTNTTASEYDPVLDGNGLTLVFRSNRGDAGTGSDLYWATRASTASDFSNVALVPKVNSASDDVQPYLMPDDSALYFSSNRGGNYDIYRTTGDLASPNPVASISEINSPTATDQNPVVSADGLMILFSSTRVGGQGASDVWYSVRPDVVSAFGTPMPLASVSSSHDDGPSWLSPDECTLYFSSNRSGTNHIYVASRK